ncbi:hypothetical protein [Sediminicola sp. 1XM1-17]|uniref:hypothetical protein n=1 Tax=Sediminicola sp. 1XM1-17 TaxID=3127702 RepID=UPI00307700A7
MKTRIIVLFLLAANMMAYAQKMPVSYDFGERYSDRYKYSNLLTMADDGDGGSILVRSYYTGLILKPKGFYIEHYNKDLELVSEFNYRITDIDFVEGYVKNGHLNLLLLKYNAGTEAYEYVIHRSPLSVMDFKEDVILSIPSVAVENPLDKNYYNRNFGSGFTTSVLFNEHKSAFAITTHFKKRKDNQHFVYLFDINGTKLMEYDFSAEIEEKNYAFEDIAVSKDLKKVYLIGKAYFKKKRFSATERKFQYELLLIDENGGRTQTFDDPGKFSEALKPILIDDKLVFVGFYADRKDNRYNGLVYFELDPDSLEHIQKKYHPFSQQFMADKFGTGEEREITNLIFKSVSVTEEKDILFNAEEYFVTKSIQQDASGARLHIDRYHYNDMVSAKLNVSGDLIWTRNINKSEVTQNDAAYASYSTYTLGNDTYFFISTASENPQQLSNQRIIFKQGYSRNRNVFLIKLDAKGDMSYEKVIDDKDARLPLMVSLPFTDKADNSMLFYAKRGTKKQLVKVSFN